MPYKFNPFTGNFDEVESATSSASPGGSNTEIQYNNSGSFGGSADLTWDDTGKELGVGGDINLTGSISVPLGSNTSPSVYFGTDVNSGLYSPGADQVAISTNGSQRATIDSSGRLLVGTSSARSNFFTGTITSPIQAEGNTANTASAALTLNSSNITTGGGLILARSNGTANGSNSLVQNNAPIGAVYFQGADGTNMIEGARIQAFVDGTPGANDMPSRLVFSSTPSGSASPTERLRITSDAYVRLASGTGGIQFNGDTGAANALDDYEEGTWSPIVTDGTTDGTMNPNSSGTYVKVGSLVTCTAYVYSSDLSALSGALSIKGLPFANGLVNRNRVGVAIGQVDNVSLGGAYSLAAHIPAGGNILLYVNDNSTGSTTLQASEVNNTFIMNIGFAYRIV